MLNGATVNALMEAALAGSDRVLVVQTRGLASSLLVSAYVEGSQIRVLFDGNIRATDCAAASLLALAHPCHASTATDAPVRAIYLASADNCHRQWVYGVVERAASVDELVTVKFDNASIAHWLYTISHAP